MISSLLSCPFVIPCLLFCLLISNLYYFILFWFRGFPSCGWPLEGWIFEGFKNCKEGMMWSRRRMRKGTVVVGLESLSLLLNLKLKGNSPPRRRRKFKGMEIWNYFKFYNFLLSASEVLKMPWGGEWRIVELEKDDEQHGEIGRGLRRDSVIAPCLMHGFGQSVPLFTLQRIRISSHHNLIIPCLPISLLDIKRKELVGRGEGSGSGSDDQREKA